jgi:hypothetical protein
MFKRYSPTLTVCVDVDDTLIIAGELNHSLVERVAGWRDDGADVVLWSARGRRYAEGVASKHDLVECFDYIIGKPGYIVDDQGWSWIRHTIVEPPPA